MNDAGPVIAITVVVGVLAMLCLIPFVIWAENHSDHMTQHEQNACIKRIEQKLDQLLEKQ